MDENDLLEISLGIFYLNDWLWIKLFICCDQFDCFVLVLFYVLWDWYNLKVCEQVGELICDVFGGWLLVYYL